jgi:hypothetical protein
VFCHVIDGTTNSTSNRHDSLIPTDSQSAVSEDINRLSSTLSNKAVHVAVTETNELDI